MATHVLQQFDAESSNVFKLGDILSGPAWATCRAGAPAFARGSDRASDGSAGDGSCFNGAVVAIAMEVSVVIGVYGLWHVWLILR
ncbi:MAG: hypothetical protein ABSE51_17020 [Terracidiphilus sp.]|jgi:hypothetical protein